jgi:hypothetical protein
MTVFEHAMVGVTGAIAAGQHRRFGWPIVAATGVAAVLPDWDGVSILFGGAAFDRAHRVWGHNLLVAGLSGAAVMVCLRLFFPFEIFSKVKSRRDPGADELPFCEPTGPCQVWPWVVMGLFAALSHLAADLVYSGHDILSDWGIQLLWPFSDYSFAYPMVPWGDVGATLIFVVTMFAMVRWPSRAQILAAIGLVSVVSYITIRGLLSL